jgi:hypothetical protein
MRSAMINAVYNSHILHMHASALRFRRAACVFLLILMSAPAILAADWRASEEQLARKIAAATGPGAVALDTANRSSLSRSDVEQIRRGLLAELGALGLRFVNADQASATVQVTFSENLQNYVWVAEIRQGNNETSAVMVATPRPILSAESSPPAALIIQKTLLWTDENRILDVALVNSTPQYMIVLEPQSVLLFRFQDGRSQQAQSLPILHSHPWARDLRGRLILRKDHLFDAYLPGIFCRSSTIAPLTLKCYESDDPWPLGTGESGLSAFFAPSRNFFTGALSPGIERQTTVGAFYSAAVLPRDKYKLWIFAGVDRQVHLLDGMRDQPVEKLDWGSDIAGVHSGCGLGWQVLVTGTGQAAVETARAFEIADREPVAIGRPVEFNGSITALWADADESGAIAVSQNSETGKYEAYRLSIICGE